MTKNVYAPGWVTRALKWSWTHQRSSPFGAEAIGQLTIPHHLAPRLSSDATDDKPVAPDPEDGGFTFRIGESRFRYDRLGLRRLRTV